MYCRSMDSFHLSGGQLSAVGSSCISDHQDALGVMCMWDRQVHTDTNDDEYSTGGTNSRHLIVEKVYCRVVKSAVAQKSLD